MSEKKEHVYTCPKCGQQLKTGIELSKPPTCSSPRHPRPNTMVKEND